MKTPPASRRAHDRSPRPGLPLSLQIFLCLLLNIMLVAGLFGWLLRSHFGVEGNWLLNDPVRDRMQAATEVLVSELREAPAEQWDEVIRRAGEAHRVQLTLYEKSGDRVAGCEFTLPEPVEERLRLYDFRKDQAKRNLWEPGAEGEEKPQIFKPFSFLTEEQRTELDRLHWTHVERVNAIFSETEAGRQFVEDGNRFPNHDAAEKRLFISDALKRTQSDRFNARHYPKEALRTSDPEGYWFLVRLPYVYPSWLVLVGKVDALGQTGLLFNPRPWLLASLAVFIGSILLWTPLIRYLTRSLSDVTGAARAIADGHFDAKVKVHRHDELGVLGAAINQMGERLQGRIAEQKRFLGDVAHELCSPLSRMEMGVSILEQRAPELDAARLVGVRQELNQIQSLVNELLTFTRTGQEILAEQPRPVPLLHAIEAATAREATEREINLRVDPGIAVMAFPQALDRALGNIIRNAVQQSSADTAIDIEARLDGETALITISDRGPGVTPEALPRLFEPFFREDTSRNRQSGGVGLGMAIVKNCLQSCGGEVAAQNRDGGGLVVAITLTAAPRS